MLISVLIRTFFILVLATCSVNGKEATFQKETASVEHIVDCTAFYVLSQGKAFRVTANHCVGNRYGMYKRDEMHDIAVTHVPGYKGPTLTLYDEAREEILTGSRACVISSTKRRAEVGIPCSAIEERTGDKAELAFIQKATKKLASGRREIYAELPGFLGTKRGTSSPINGMSGSPLIVCETECAVVGLLTNALETEVPGNERTPTWFAHYKRIEELIRLEEK